MDEYSIGDLVISHLIDSGGNQSLLGIGIVIDINKSLQDIMVLDQCGNCAWWSHRTWQIISKYEND